MRLVFKCFYILFFFSSTFLFADTLCSYEFFNQGHALQEHVMRNGYNAPACIELDAGFNIITKGTCLYWNATEQGLDLGYTLSNNTYEIHKMDFDYHLGAKGTIGFHLPHDGWDFNFTYLFYQNEKDSRHIQSNNFNDYWYTKRILTQENIQKIHSKWKLELNLMDAYFSRAFYLGTHLTLEPFIGAKGGWIDQKFKIPGFTTFFINQDLKNKTRSDSWILGGLGGVNTNWIIVDFFRIYANFAGALLYQRFKIHNNQQIIIENIPVSDIFVKYKFRNVTPCFETSFGIAWGTYFYNKRLHIDFSVGYDFAVFLEQNAIAFVISNLNNQSSGASLNNLTLRGVSGALRLDF